MDAHIGNAVEPLPSLRVEIGIVEEGAAVHEIAAQIPDGPLDFPFVCARYGRHARGVKLQ